MEELKNIIAANFAEFPLSTLEHYITKCEKIIANMVSVDPIVLDILSRLEDELKNRG